MAREDIFDLDVFTEESLDKRVAKIRREEGGAFSKAALIVMRARYPNGYLLKQTFDQADKDATFVDVQLPRVDG